MTEKDSANGKEPAIKLDGTARSVLCDAWTKYPKSIAHQAAWVTMNCLVSKKYDPKSLGECIINNPTYIGKLTSGANRIRVQHNLTQITSDELTKLVKGTITLANAMMTVPVGEIRSYLSTYKSAEPNQAFIAFQNAVTLIKKRSK